MLNLFIPIAGFLIWFLPSIYRYSNINSTSYDLGIFSNAIYLISNNYPANVDLIHKPILSDHNSFVFYAIALLYKIFDSPALLLILQSLGCSLIFFPIYKLCKNKHLVCFICILNPIIFSNLLFDFHPDMFFLPLCIYGFYFAYRKNFKSFILCCLLILTLKEFLSVGLVCLGIFFLLQRNYKYGSTAFILGIIGFIVHLKLMNSYGYAISGLSRFDAFGTSVPEIFLNIITNPIKLISIINFKDSLKYTLYILLIFSGFLINKSFIIPVLAASPLILINWISDTNSQRMLNYHYSTPIAAILLLGIIAQNTTSSKGIKPVLATTAISFILILTHGIINPEYLHNAFQQRIHLDDEKELINALRHSDKSLLSYSNSIPQLSNRIHVSDFNSDSDFEKYDLILFNFYNSNIDQEIKNEVKIFNSQKFKNMYSCINKKKILYLCQKI